MEKSWRNKILFLGLLSCLLLAACRSSTETVQPTPTRTDTAAMQDLSILRIHELQGAQHRSPYDGKSISGVEGIVTAITGSGFYLQEPVPDEDERTSEALFVSANAFGGVRVGDLVIINQAKVREYNPAGLGENSLTRTELFQASYVVLSSGNPLPEAIVIGETGRRIPNYVIENDVNGYASRNGEFDPAQDGLDFFESLEGMRVQVNDALAVSSTSSYNEVTVVADLGKNASILSARNVLVLRQDDANPERIILDDAFINMPTIRVGARFTAPIIGIMDYSYGNFKLQPTQKLRFEQGKNPEESVSYQLGENELAVATYNVANFNPMIAPERLSTLAEHIVKNLRSPDIIALQEIQDDDGELDSAQTSAAGNINKLIQKVKQLGGPDYRALSIDPLRNADGGVNGGNIRVVLLYREDRGLSAINAQAGDTASANQVLNKAGKPILSLNPGRVSPQSYAFRDSRKPLAAQFRFLDQDVFVIVCHLNSKGEDGPLFGDQQPPPLVSERQRLDQAREINAFVRNILAIDPNANVIVLGDLNDFAWSPPIEQLQAGALVNLITLLPENERYTYIHEGNGQVLDHILVSVALSYKVSYFDVLHLNSENVPGFRVSDHDPAYAVLKFD
ncbi:MAG TPA: endonuclease/exonuclease/phosphatase family protein [Anaerolineaceae bacterium]|nr:endonuclease/exonuclease/phosphatase family protein [Anaerolineaceae bacterium]